MRFLMAFVLATTCSAEAQFCESLIADVQSIRPGLVYIIENTDRHLGSVQFSEDVTGDLEDVDSRFPARLLRAILHGFVGAHSRSGIVRLRDIHKDLVEVKVIGTDLRVLGCVNKGHLTLKRMIKKRNENKGGSLARYAYLCEK